MPSLRSRAAALAGAVLLAVCAGCSSSSGDATSSPQSGSDSSGATGQASFPTTFTDDEGHTVQIKEKPKNVVSTSVVLTGSLLAIDAPVKGSGAAQPNQPGFDDQGFFAHWGSIAKQRGVKALYTKSTLDLEAVTAAAPDLIVISSSGGDSTKDQYAQLSQIAPTISINYLTTSWQDVERKLGKATGDTAGAEKVISDYDTQIADLKAKTAPPSDPVQSIVFNAEGGSAFLLPNSPQDQVFKALGFTLAPVDTSKAQQSEGGGKRTDVAFLSAENSIAALTAKVLLLVDGDAATVAQLKKTAGYSTTPAVQPGGKVVPLEHSSFKMDYYSALAMAKSLQSAFPKS